MVETSAEDYGWSREMHLPLLQKIKLDLKTALKKNDTEVRNTIRLIMGEFPGLTVPLTLESGKRTTRLKKPEEITDEDIQDIIRRLIKSEKIVLELKKERPTEYLRILESYLPKMATREEIMAWVDANVDFTKLKNPVQAMGTIMKHFGKLADGNLVKEILAVYPDRKSSS